MRAQHVDPEHTPERFFLSRVVGVDPDTQEDILAYDVVLKGE